MIETKIPNVGLYFTTGGASYRLLVRGERVHVTLIDTLDRGTPPLWVTMPGSTAVTIEPGK